MKYFIDTEFLEGIQDKTIFGIKCGKTKPTIDLISIGIVAEDGREYYAISKDFNLKEAWNRFQMKETSSAKKYLGFYEEKEYWIRDNVLKPIFADFLWSDNDKLWTCHRNSIEFKKHINKKFTYNNLKKFINKYGKSNKQIAEEIVRFTNPVQNMDKNIPDYIQIPEQFKIDYSKPEFYGYYADYDWVVFCWLFGRMIDLPKGFPKYCRDLKQMLYDKAKEIFESKPNLVYFDSSFNIKNQTDRTIKEVLNAIKNHSNYPQQTNEHNALADAKWNRELHKFINSL